MTLPDHIETGININILQIINNGKDLEFSLTDKGTPHGRMDSESYSLSFDFHGVVPHEEAAFFDIPTRIYS